MKPIEQIEQIEQMKQMKQMKQSNEKTFNFLFGEFFYLVISVLILYLCVAYIVDSV